MKNAHGRGQGRRNRNSLSLHSSWNNLPQIRRKLEALKWVKAWVIVTITAIKIIQNSNLHLYSSLLFPNNIIYLSPFGFHGKTVPISRWRGWTSNQRDYVLACFTKLIKHAIRIRTQVSQPIYIQCSFHFNHIKIIKIFLSADIWNKWGKSTFLN